MSFRIIRAFSVALAAIMTVVLGLTLLNVHAAETPETFDTLELDSRSADVKPLPLRTGRSLAQTSTPTVTLLPSSTLTVTLSYSSVQEIRDALGQDLGEITGLLHTISETVKPEGWAQEVTESFRDEFLWEYIGSPVSAWVLSLLGLIFASIRTALGFGQKKKEAEAETQKRPTRKLILGLDLATIVIFVAILVLLLVRSSLVRMATAPTLTTRDLDTVVERLDRLDRTLQGIVVTEVSQTPTPTVQEYGDEAQPDSRVQELGANINPIVTLVLLISLAINIVLILVPRWRAKHLEPPMAQTRITAHNLSDERILNAVPLALIAILLPYPASALVLPFILPFFLFSFFDAVYLYPNRYLKGIVKRYWLLVLLASFGAWLRFADAMVFILEPGWQLFQVLVWDALGTMSFGTLEQIPLLAQVIAYLSRNRRWTFVLALILGIPGGLRISRYLGQDIIPKILDKMDGFDQRESSESEAE